MLRHNFDVVLTVSNAVRSFCIEADGIAPERVFTLYNGVAKPEPNPDARRVIRARHNLPPDIPVVVMVGNIRRIKGIDTLLETAALVCAQIENIAFLVVGGVSEPDYFQELTESQLFSGMADRFIFAGPSQEVGTYLQGADVFCMLSRSEGFSNALLEAMSCGLPAVVTDVGGNSEALIDGEHGFLVPVGDSGAAAKHILDLLANRSFREQMGTSARQRVKSHFSTESMIRGLDEIYGRLLRRQTGLPRGKTSVAS
jgi:glycosyltransferase involved in cell wall biosynthesis